MKIISDLIGTKLSEFRIKLASISSASLTANRTLNLPDKDGTIALTSDIPNTNGAWTTFTPSFTGLTVGSGGTITGRYKLINDKTVAMAIVITLGSSPSVTSTVQLTYPTELTPVDNRSVIQDVTYRDTSSGLGFQGKLYFRQLVYETGSSFAAVTSTVPFAWAVNDTIHINLLYETQ